MKIKQSIISLLKRLGQAHRPKKKVPPESLPPEVMAKVMEEVNFLRTKYGVEVRSLAPDEFPTVPKRAD